MVWPQRLVTSGENETSHTRLHREDLGRSLFKLAQHLMGVLHPKIRTSKPGDIPPRGDGDEEEDYQSRSESEDNFAFE